MYERKPWKRSLEIRGLALSCVNYCSLSCRFLVSERERASLPYLLHIAYVWGNPFRGDFKSTGARNPYPQVCANSPKLIKFTATFHPNLVGLTLPPNDIRARSVLFWTILFYSLYSSDLYSCTLGFQELIVWSCFSTPGFKKQSGFYSSAHGSRPSRPVVRTTRARAVGWLLVGELGLQATLSSASLSLS